MPRFIRQRGTIDIYDVEARLYQKVINACQKQANLAKSISKTTKAMCLKSRQSRRTSKICFGHL